MKHFIGLLLIAGLSSGSPVPAADTENFIIGGHPTWIQNFPHQASLRPWWSNFHLCGASIIHERWVLTAAHCTVWYEDDHLHVWVGASFLNEGGLPYRSDLILEHEDYNDRFLTDDVALIRTREKFAIDNWSVKIIPMATHFTQGGATVTVSGWGFVDNNRTVPNQLQRANKFAMSHSECLERIDPWTDFVPTSKLCTRAIRNTLGVCQGDSGGPLVETVDGKTVLVGVVSFGGSGGWCATDAPDGFDRVAHHRTWILNQIRKH